MRWEIRRERRGEGIYSYLEELCTRLSSEQRQEADVLAKLQV